VPFHKALLLFAAHGLGYDNCRKESYTGEAWFVTNILKVANPKVCIDVGANVGMYTRLLLAHTSASVYSIEPSSSSFVELRKEKRAVVVRTALSNFEGEAKLYSEGDRAVTASLDRRAEGGHVESVSVTTLSAFADAHGLKEIDLLKVDTEGYEREVLEGMGALRPRFIQFEFNVFHLRRGHTLFSICALLPDYAFFRLLPNGWTPVDPAKFADNLFVFSNIVAVRRESGAR